MHMQIEFLRQAKRCSPCGGARIALPCLRAQDSPATGGPCSVHDLLMDSIHHCRMQGTKGFPQEQTHQPRVCVRHPAAKCQHFIAESMSKSADLRIGQGNSLTQRFFFGTALCCTRRHAHAMSFSRFFNPSQSTTSTVFDVWMPCSQLPGCRICMSLKTGEQCPDPVLHGGNRGSETLSTMSNLVLSSMGSA